MKIYPIRCRRRLKIHFGARKGTYHGIGAWKQEAEHDLPKDMLAWRCGICMAGFPHMARRRLRVCALAHLATHSETGLGNARGTEGAVAPIFGLTAGDDVMWRCPLCKLGIPKGLSQRMADHMRAKHRLEAHADFSKEDWASAIRGGKGKRAEALGHTEVKFHTMRWKSIKTGNILEEKRLNRWCATCWYNLHKPWIKRVACTGKATMPPRRYWKWWKGMRSQLK